MICCAAYSEASNDDAHAPVFLNRFEISAGGYRQWSTLPPIEFCPWCGASKKQKPTAAATWEIRECHLFSEALDGVFHSIGNNFYLFEAGGEPRQLICHERGAWQTIWRDLTADERAQWARKRMLDYRDVKFSTGWQEKRW